MHGPRLQIAAQAASRQPTVLPLPSGTSQHRSTPPQQPTPTRPPTHHLANPVPNPAGEVVPASVADNLMRLIGEGTGEEGAEEADRELRAAVVEAYLDLLDRPKLPAVLLKVQ